ncbi:TIGR03084 family metal-binding protein [Rhodococcus chondri]|uniref:TIGR03084 family metal-binding protein n=1 Tax=Rhodococcus chondri TaxID=3065941 RepID=A0ABU7JMJ4_9NOCA|nr:TIGR03084 family metal-binding protein [Rhodococcus sp. CC-R104]MEE2031263.1 TIGR03084 family metal-binding protein [Rhodococcus sp. CC-R104]
MNQLAHLIDDLEAEQMALDEIVATFGNDEWNRLTPAEGWTSRHQIAHLAFFDTAAEMSLTDPDAFAEQRRRADQDPDAYSVAVLEPLLELSSEQLLDTWRQGRRSLLHAFRSAPTGTRHPWYGPSMSLASMVTARLMETWAHGQDVADTAGTARAVTSRLGHIARIACLAFPFSFTNRGMSVPDTGVRVCLSVPSGGAWEFGEEGLEDSVSGPIEDFCLVLTRRRHVADTDLIVTGPIAREWMTLGQAYAGPPGHGRTPGQFAQSKSLRSRSR